MQGGGEEVWAIMHRHIDMAGGTWPDGGMGSHTGPCISDLYLGRYFSNREGFGMPVPGNASLHFVNTLGLCTCLAPVACCDPSGIAVTGSAWFRHRG